MARLPGSSPHRTEKFKEDWLKLMTFGVTGTKLKLWIPPLTIIAQILWDNYHDSPSLISLPIRQK